MVNFYHQILELFEKNSDVLFGVSNIEFCEFKSDYKCALVFAVPHKLQLNLKNYLEERFEELICEARDSIIILLDEITRILEEHNINYFVPPVAQSSEKTLIAPFSFKFAAVNAGLGWIGKNGVLITEEYGPRVRLSSILINYDLPQGTPIIKSKCPSGCNICVSACPYKALKGILWDINIKRDEIIDYHLCNQKRSLFIKTHNWKSSCGLCLVSCPYGLKSLQGGH